MSADQLGAIIRTSIIRTWRSCERAPGWHAASVVRASCVWMEVSVGGVKNARHGSKVATLGAITIHLLERVFATWLKVSRLDDILMKIAAVIRMHPLADFATRWHVACYGGSRD